jgi:AcrR family transcriptional regulator
MSKGTLTRDRILDRAVQLASRDGLGGLSIGSLAGELQLSKSGLYAHFGSKEELQVQAIERAVARFTELVLRPALRAPRGEPRIREVFRRWLDWGLGTELPGGCFINMAAVELDDHPGKPRDVLAAVLDDWRASLERLARTAVEEGHFRSDVDPAQFCFDLYGIVLSTYLASRMMEDQHARERAAAAFERLIQDSRP